MSTSETVDPYMLQTDPFTLSAFVLSQQHIKAPGARGHLTVLLNAIAVGCKFVSTSVRKVGRARARLGTPCCFNPKPAEAHCNLGCTPDSWKAASRHVLRDSSGDRQGAARAAPRHPDP